jgi:nucleoside-diphosphate-sugar epimerase
MYRMSKKPTSRDLQALETEKKVTDMAMKLVREYGYDRVTISQICEACGVAKGTFYSYFTSKKDILIKLTSRFNKELSQLFIFDESLRAATLYRNMVTSYLNYVNKDGHAFTKSYIKAMIDEELAKENVVASSRRIKEGHEKLIESGPFEVLNINDSATLASIVDKYKINTIVNLAAVLSAVGENDPQQCWHINMNGLYNVLEVAKEKNCMVYTPSSIAAFGPGTPKDKTPQDTIQRPTTMYGVTKVAGELLCDYYYKRFGVDTRGVRFPGLISYATLPGGGTTDYAVHIYYEALKNKKYSCFIQKGTFMDMMYMPDALRAIIDLIEANPDKLKHRNAFNVSAMSFDPEMLASSIRKYIPEFELDYDVDPIRQCIAESWPNSLDDSAAREEWGWNPKYDLDSMTKDMLEKLRIKLNIQD